MDKNKLGGFNYEDKEDKKRAKEADLITLPKDLQDGINCSNCIFVEIIDSKAGIGFCKHPEVKLAVNKTMCCKFWKNKSQINSWEK